MKAPFMMKEYWNRPDATAEAFDNGWFRTGDIAEIDDEGFIFIKDRIKDMIISGGENIYPAEIENVLMRHDGIADVAVIGVPHAKWGETVKAIVVRADPALTEPDVIAFARDRLAAYKCPTTVDWVDVLPRNPSGKVLKTDLRAPYWASRERLVN